MATCGRLGKETIAKRLDLDLRTRSPGEKVVGGFAGLIVAYATAAQHAPMHVELDATLHKAQQHCACADLDVVRMRSQTKQRQVVARSRKLERPHHAALAARGDCTRHGISPRSTMSSRT